MKFKKLIGIGGVFGISVASVFSVAYSFGQEKINAQDSTLEKIDLYDATNESEDDSSSLLPLPVLDHEKYIPQLGSGELPINNSSRYFEYPKQRRKTYTFEGISSVESLNKISLYDHPSLSPFDYARNTYFGQIIKTISDDTFRTAIPSFHTPFGERTSMQSKDSLQMLKLAEWYMPYNLRNDCSGWNYGSDASISTSGWKAKFTFRRTGFPWETDSFWLVSYGWYNGNANNSIMGIIPVTQGHSYNGVPTIFGVPIKWTSLMGGDLEWATTQLTPSYISCHVTKNPKQYFLNNIFSNLTSSQRNGNSASAVNGKLFINDTHKPILKTVEGIVDLLNSPSNDKNIYFSNADLKAPNFDPIVIDKDKLTKLHSLITPVEASNYLKINGKKIDSTFSNDGSYQVSDPSVSRQGLLTFYLEKKLGASFKSEYGHTDKLRYSIQMNVVDLKGLFTIDYSTSQNFDYSSGERAYYRERPSLYLEWNKKYFDALDAWDDSIGVIKSLESVNYVSVKDKELAIKSASSGGGFKINKSNIQDFIANYNNTKNLDLESLDSGGWTDYIEDGIVNKQTKKILPYVLKNSELYLDIKANLKAGASDTKSLEFKNLLNNELKIQVPSTFLSEKLGNQWIVDLSNISIVTPDNTFTPSIVTPVSEKDLKDLYKVDFRQKNSSTGSNVYEWIYNHQVKPKAIDQDITWTNTNNGVVMDDKFRIIRDDKGSEVTPPSKLSSKDFGWDAAYYHFNIASNKEDNKAKLFINMVNGEWIVPSLSRPLKDILSTHATFDSNKITYLFGAPLHLITNPYTNLKSGNNIPTAEEYIKSGASYGIEKVTDEQNNTISILEDWTDGRMNHLRDENGIPKVDGIFGADLNGYDTPEGIFTSGVHKVDIQLAMVSSLQTKFNFEVDTTRPDVNIDSSVGNPIRQKYHSFLKPDANGKIGYSSGEEVITSDKPITLDFKDANLKSVTAEIYDLKKQRATFSVPVIAKEEDGELVYAAHFIVNYQGFISFKLEDYAGHTSIKNVYINQEGVGAGSEVMLEKSSSGERLKTLFKDSITINVDNVEASGEMRIYQALSHESHIFLDADPSHGNVHVSKMITDGALAHWEDAEKLSDVEVQNTIVSTIGDKFGQVIPDTPKYDLHTGKIIPVDASSNMGIELSPMLTSIGTLSSKVSDALINYKPSAFKVNSGIYRVQYDILIGDNVQKKTYFIYALEGDINSIGAPIDMTPPKWLPSGLSHFAISATITDDFKNSRDTLKSKEKDTFLALVDQLRAEATLKEFNENYDDELSRGTAEAQKVRQNELDRIAEIEKNPVMVEEKTLDLELNHLRNQSPKDITKINSKIDELNKFRAKKEFIDLNSEIDTIRKNIDGKVEAVISNYQKTLDRQKELQDDLSEKTKIHDKLLQEWKDALVYLDTKNIVYADDKIVGPGPIFSFLYDPSSEGHWGMAGYISTHSTGLYSTVAQSIKQRGWVGWRPLGSPDSVEKHQDALMVIKDESGNIIFRYTNLNPLTGEIEDSDMPLINPDTGSSTYDCDNMIWNGAEAEDFDHLLMKQKMFIEKAPDVDGDKLFGMLEEYNSGLANGKILPLNPLTLKDYNHKISEKKDSHEDKSSSGIGVGAIVGISLGITSLIGLISYIIIWRLRTRKLK